MNSRRTRTTRGEQPDENDVAAAPTTRLTRAKAASLTSKTTTTTTAAGAKKPLANKNATGTTQAAAKRNALGDVSNVHKGETGAGKQTGKKVVTTKTRTQTTARATTRSTREAETREKASKPAVAVSKKRPATENAENDVETRAGKKNVLGAISEEGGAQVASRAAKKPRLMKDTLEDEFKPASEYEGWDDLDEEDKEDPFMVSEYVDDIMKHWLEVEKTYMANPKYIEGQKDITWSMRGVLVDWMIEVHASFKLLPETLYLAVNIVDRFLSTKVVPLDRVQLAGITGLFIASKVEEVYSPHISYFAKTVEGGYTESEILASERFVLASLQYGVSFPNPLNYCRRISKADDYDVATRTYAKYFLEVALVDHRFLKYTSSHVAAASMYLARLIMQNGDWNVNCIHYSNYTEREVLPVFKLFIDHLLRPVKNETVKQKYSHKKYMRASVHSRNWAKKYASKYGVKLDADAKDAGAEADDALEFVEL